MAPSLSIGISQEVAMKSIVVDFWESKDSVKVPVNLVAVPTVTADKATTPVFGRWVCTSPYIGKRSLGLFYIKRIPERLCASNEEMWTGGCELPRNPYAFFFDTDDEAKTGRPFMFLDHFYLDIGASSSGQGNFTQAPFVSGSGYTFKWNQAG
jgi:hypothetical protein